MNTIKKKIIVSALVTVLTGMSLFGVTSAFAQDFDKQSSTLVQKIAERFNLNRDDVQKVFDEELAARHAEKQAHFEEKLTQAVTKGQINEAQKQAILVKFQEMKHNKPDKSQFSNMTDEQRRLAMEQKRTELDSWAKEQGLDSGTLQDLLGHRKVFGKRGFDMKSGTTSAAPSPTMSQ